MSLTSCLKKAGSAINAEDKAAILTAARLYRAGGMKPDEAAAKALDDQMAVLQGEITKAEPPTENGELSEEPADQHPDGVPGDTHKTND